VQLSIRQLVELLVWQSIQLLIQLWKSLVNQWAERRPVTLVGECRAMRRSVCNARASNGGGRFLCVQISRERSYPPANILIPLERQLIALQLCRWQFLQRAQCSHCKRCISYDNSLRLSVRLSHAGIVSKRRHQSMILFVLQLTCWISYNKHRINLHNTQYKIK